MARKCELCEAEATRVSATEHAPGRLRRVLVEDRVVALCEPHAAKVRERAPTTIAELQRAFPERRGQRSLFERRAPLDRRAFPARPEGRRRGGGRRATDRAR